MGGGTRPPRGGLFEGRRVRHPRVGGFPAPRRRSHRVVSQPRDAPLTVTPRAVTFHPDALADAREAAEYYALRVPHLGAEFIDEVRRVVALAAERPEVGGPMRAGRRRLVVHAIPVRLGLPDRAGRFIARARRRAL